MFLGVFMISYDANVDSNLKRPATVGLPAVLVDEGKLHVWITPVADGKSCVYLFGSCILRIFGIT